MFEADSRQKSLVLEIQQAAMADEADVAHLLRKAKVAAVKLNQTDAIHWINNELNGYDCRYDDLPDYRKSHGVLKARNPYHGLIPILIKDSRTEELVTRTPFVDSIATLQNLVKGNTKKGGLHYNMSTKHRNFIMEKMEIPMEPILLISTSQIVTILNKVTSLVLDWSLELEAQGILGTGMTFKPEDPAKAAVVTNNIIAQNVGQIGNNSDNADTQISQNAHGDQNIDQKNLSNFLSQAIPASEMLPDNIREEVKKKLYEVENTTDSDTQSNLLNSIKTVLEGASGNLAAVGMLQLLGTVFP